MTVQGDGVGWSHMQASRPLPYSLFRLLLATQFALQRGKRVLDGFTD
jgi:hypothetical protein